MFGGGPVPVLSPRGTDASVTVNHLVADPKISPRCQNVPGIGELLSEIHQRIQRPGKAPHETAKEGQPGEKVPLGQRGTESIRLPQNSLHHGPNPPTLRPGATHNLGGGRIRLRGWGGWSPR